MPATEPRPHEVLADRIAETAAHASIAKHSLLKLIADFDEMDGWFHQGAISCAQWLSWRIGLAPGAAREQVRVALALRALPKTDAAFGCGKLSYSKVRALTRVATPESEGDLVDIADSSTAAQLERICRKFRGVIDELEKDRRPEDVEARRYVRAQHTGDGMMQFNICLLADEGARLLAAINSAADAAFEDAKAIALAADAATDPVHRNDANEPEQPTSPRRRNRADGLMIVAESFAAETAATSRGDAGCEVIVRIEADALADKTEGGFIDSAGGTGVSAEMVRRLSCDCAAVGVVEDGHGRVLNVGRRTRTIPSAIRRALRVRDDETCRFPGCTHRRFLEAHHIHHWADGGETKLDNLLLVCKRHHRFVHEHGFTIHAGADGALTFQSPRGSTLRPVPSMPSVPPSVVEDLIIQHREEGLDVDAWTATPRYYRGEPMDLHHVISTLADAWCDVA